MSIPQPIATDNLDAPDHSLLHRQIAADTAAPAKSLIADSAGKIGIGTETPAQQLDVAGSIQLSGNLTDGTNASSPANIKDAVDKKHAASGQFNQAAAAEISGLTEKTTPVDADVLLIEDSAASYAKKKILKSSLGAGDMSYANTRFFCGVFTRDMTSAGGTQAITGIGFAPRAIIAWGVIEETSNACWGMWTAAGGNHIRTPDNVTFTPGKWSEGTQELRIATSVSADQRATLASMDSDGFTLTWEKNGSPTGTLEVNFMAFR